MNGRPWAELSEAEHQQYPGDYEAQVGQGPISIHSEEHFGTTDRGIAMLRRYLSRQVQAVRNGENPAGVQFEPGSERVASLAGNFLDP